MQGGVSFALETQLSLLLQGTVGFSFAGSLLDRYAAADRAAVVEVAQCAKLHTRPCTALHMITIFTLDSVHPMDCAWSANCATADACFFHRTSLCTKLKYLYFCIGLSTHSIYSSFKSIGVDLHTLPHRFPNAVRPLCTAVSDQAALEGPEAADGR